MASQTVPVIWQAPNTLWLESAVVAASVLAIIVYRYRRMFRPSAPDFAKRALLDLRVLGVCQIACASVLTNRATYPATTSFFSPESVSKGWWAGVRACLFLVSGLAACQQGWTFRATTIALSPVLLVLDMASEVFQAYELDCIASAACSVTDTTTGALQLFIVRDLASIGTTAALLVYVIISSAHLGLCHNRVLVLPSEHRRLAFQDDDDDDDVFIK